MGLKQLFKRGKDRTTADGLAKEHVNAIQKYFGAMKDGKLSAALVRFIVSGTGEEVLLTLGGDSDAAKQLGYDRSGNVNYNLVQRMGGNRALMLRGDRQAAPEVWIRMAQVLEAAQRAGGAAAALPPGWPSWLGVLLSEIVLAFVSFRREGEASCWSADELEKILTSANLPPDFLTQPLLDRDASNQLHSGYGYYYGANSIGAYRDVDRYLLRHAATVRSFLTQATADQRVYALNSLGSVKFDFTSMLDMLVDIGTGSSKTARDAALPLLMGCRDQARTFAEKVLADGDAGQRHEAAVLLWRLFGPDAADTLRQHAAQETAERTKQTIEKLLAAPTDGAAFGAQATGVELPPLTIEVGEVPLPEEAKEGLRSFFQRGYENALRHYEQQVKQWEGPSRPQWMQKPEKPVAVSREYLNSVIQVAEGTQAKPSEASNKLWQIINFAGAFGDWLSPPGVKLIHVVRLSHAVGHLQVQGHGSRLWWPNQSELEAYRSRCQPPFGLRELNAVVATLAGIKPGEVLDAYLATNNKYQSFCDWEPEAIWPAFAERPEVLHEVLNPSGTAKGNYSADYWLGMKRRGAFRVLAMFPQVPAGFIPLLWDLALGEGKTERPLAQEALASLPGKAGKVIVALGDGKQNIRAAAAEWLGKLGDAAAVEPLKECFRKEKSEAVKGTVLLALDALNADVNEFLDRDKLVSEAKAGLEKKRPKGMEWVPLDSLPALHWQDNGKKVDTRIVQWWVVQSIQQKSPVPGPLVRRYLGMCRPAETTALARFLLSSWIGRDTTHMSQEDAAARAKEETDKLWGMYGGHQYFKDAYSGKKENLYQQNLQKFSTDCIYSAIEQKGLLALVAATGEADCVKMSEQYIRNWFGNRLAQCKCLIEVLAWIDHPLALQALLSIANRFRTKALRQAAEEYVQAIADRQGWTIDELADRTIPDAGFERPLDEKGVPTGDAATLELDYGPRKFQVRLNDDLEPVITNEEGKTIKSPPAPGKNDDAEKAKAAKKAFTDAKKVVKEVVRRQAERLYEAMCTQRSWKFGIWKSYLAQHPIVGRLCIRLAWAFDKGETGHDKNMLHCLRPVEDGSLTNEKDEEVTLPDDAAIYLAHTCNTSPETGAAWLKHFQDYDVEPLFQQFGRSTYALAEDKKKETDINDFEGHALTTFQLRGKATKLGYVRGESEDGGCFYLYRKPFPSLGIQAQLQFTGSFLPEQDMPAALASLYFTQIKGDREQNSWMPAKMPLGKVPAVLLSECYNDIRQMAAEGTGYDPKWQEKSYF